MDARTRKLNCRTCHDFEYFQVEMTLSGVYEATTLGCLRCKLLSKSAGLFRDRWLHLDKREEKSVRLIVSKKLTGGSGLVQTLLKWPSKAGHPEELAIQITTEGDYIMFGFSFAKSRGVASSATATECLDFIRSRLASCDENHEACKKGTENEAARPKRLLRIDDSGDSLKVFLVETSDLRQKYVALSHCWGSSDDTPMTKIPKTTRENLEIHKSIGLSELSLTRTFRDALDVTRKLGVEYIWIDSLCIIQGDKDDWKKECPKMGYIYGEAYLVIAATLAKNGDHGLYRERPPRRIEFLTSAGQTLKAAVCEKAHHDVWKKGEQFWEAPELPLFGRAWAFQERLLARRLIHFTPTELVWECRSCVDCECGDLQNPQTHWPEFGAGKNLKSRYGEVVRWGSNVDRINFWHIICAQYSARQLTLPTDRLPALSSIAKQIDMPDALGGYLAGIWECTLPEGLLWWSEFTNPKLYGPGTKTHQRAQPRCEPTWSWLSIEGRVSTWGRIQVPSVRILHISYTLDSDDRYGPCREGIISIIGRGIPVEVIDAKRSDGPSNKEVRLPGREDSFDFTTDTNPFEYSDQDLRSAQLLALQFAAGHMFYCHVIVLKLVPGTSIKYERLGIADCPHEWFAEQTARVIQLV